MEWYIKPSWRLDTRVDILEMIAVDYHLKSQEDKDPRKKQVYKNISKTAELKSDIARKTEEREEPKI